MQLELSSATAFHTFVCVVLTVFAAAQCGSLQLTFACVAADPFLNDQNFVLSVLSLEELGATGNKGLAGLTGNPVLANGIAGLATSATAQATVQRMLLWQMRDYMVEPFGETVQQVFARVSALRDSLDGPQVRLADEPLMSCSIFMERIRYVCDCQLPLSAM